MKNILIFSTSLRADSNSEILAESFAEGCKDAGHSVETISLKEKNINFCQGCNTCDNTGTCIIKDDAHAIADQAQKADVLVFATPMYHGSVSGAMKTLLDRLTPLMARDYNFRDVYFTITAADNTEGATKAAEADLAGWIGSFKKTELKGVIRGQGIDLPKDAANHADIIEEAYEMGKSI